MNHWIPEDVTGHWASLLPEFQQRALDFAGCQITIGVLVENGYWAKLLEPKVERIEPNGRGPQKAQNWWNVIRRIQSIGANVTGEAIVTTRVLLNAHGDPVCWTAPESVRLEPKRRR